MKSKTKTQITCKLILESHILLIIVSIASYYFSNHLFFIYVSLILFFSIATYTVFPKPAQTITRMWLLLGDFLGNIMSRVILTLTFYFILTPLAFLYRLFNKEKLMLTVTHQQGSKESYFLDRNHCYSKKDFNNPW